MTDQQQAAQNADLGIHRAASRAERRFENWVHEAVEALGWAASQMRAASFTIEELRGLCGELPAPSDLRAWGAATRRATRLGYIVRTDGYAPAASSNNSPKPLYTAGSWS